MRNTVLMDLDGTLLLFEQEAFIKHYFHHLCAQLSEFDPDRVVRAVWTGTKAMMQNDGSVCNRDRFWDAFAAEFGEEIRAKEAILDTFYRTAFDKVRTVLARVGTARRLVDTLKAKGYTLVLATNPIFPKIAVTTRMAWVGLREEDFAHITHYENSRFCKPNTAYYEEILKSIGKRADECYMIGNSVHEDLVAETLGLEVLFLPEFEENPLGLPTDRYRRFTLEELTEAVQAWDEV